MLDKPEVLANLPNNLGFYLGSGHIVIAFMLFVALLLIWLFFEKLFSSFNKFEVEKPFFEIMFDKNILLRFKIEFLLPKKMLFRLFLGVFVFNTKSQENESGDSEIGQLNIVHEVEVNDC